MEEKKDHDKLIELIKKHFMKDEEDMYDDEQEDNEDYPEEAREEAEDRHMDDYEDEDEDEDDEKLSKQKRKDLAILVVGKKAGRKGSKKM